jgi:ribosomal protein S11
LNLSYIRDKAINNKKTKYDARIMIALLAIGLILFSSTIIVQASAQQQQQQQQQSNATSATSSRDPQTIFSDFANKFRTLVNQSGTNLTLPAAGSLSDFVQNIQNTTAFKTLSEKFTQLAQQSGVNSSAIQLRDPQEGRNLTGLVEKLENRLANRTQG